MSVLPELNLFMIERMQQIEDDVMSCRQSQSPDAGFVECIEALKSGPWNFIQLRGESVDAANPPDDDIDLLGSPESVETLLSSALEWVRERRCHLRVRSRNQDKIEFTIFSIDGRFSILFDLWITLRQFDHGRCSLTYEACSHAVVDSGSSIQRFSVDIEAAVYIQHLISKKKNLKSPRIQQRLADYAFQCEATDHRELCESMFTILETNTIPPSIVRKLALLIEENLSPPTSQSLSDRLMRLTAKAQAQWLGPPRQTRMLTMMGCDGAGKTTLAHTLKDDSENISKVYTGKHLYRKSLSYKLAVIFIRPLIFQDRERFDEILAPFVYLRGCLGLRLLRLFSKKNRVTLIDRSLIDFLYVDRKSDSPKFSRFRWLTRLFGLRVPNVHCLVSHENVMQRKQEVTAEGHHQYDEDIFQEFALRCPTDYIAFNNDGDLTAATSSLQRIFNTMPVTQASAVEDVKRPAAKFLRKAA